MTKIFYEGKILKPTNNLDFLQCKKTLRELDNWALGTTIKNLRATYNLTQNKAAIATSIEQSHMSDIENAKHSLGFHKVCNFSRNTKIPMREIGENVSNEFTRLVNMADKFIFEDEYGGYYIFEENLFDQSDNLD